MVKRQVKISVGRSAVYSAGESAGEASAAAATVSASFQGVIDLFAGPAVAFSVGRRLNSAYTGPLIRIRRSSDNAEEDIPYIDSTTAVLNEARINDFTGGVGDAFITTIYDQSGNGRNATQATATLQPKIVNAGAIVRMGPNNRPGILFPGSTSASDVNGRLDTGVFTLGGTQLALYMARERIPVSVTDSYQILMCQGDVGSARRWLYEEADIFVARLRPRGGTDPTFTESLRLASLTGTKAYVFTGLVDIATSSANGHLQQHAITAAGGVTVSASPTYSNTLGGSFTSTTFRLGARHDNKFPAWGRIGEVIIYGNIAVGSASAGVQNNIHTFWGSS